MGNSSITNRISYSQKVDLVAKFNVEDLIGDSLLDSIYEQFQSQSSISADVNESYKADF